MLTKIRLALLTSLLLTSLVSPSPWQVYTPGDREYLDVGEVKVKWVSRGVTGCPKNVDMASSVVFGATPQTITTVVVFDSARSLSSSLSPRSAEFGCTLESNVTLRVTGWQLLGLVFLPRHETVDVTTVALEARTLVFVLSAGMTGMRSIDVFESFAAPALLVSSTAPPSHKGEVSRATSLFDADTRRRVQSRISSREWPVVTNLSLALLPGAGAELLVNVQNAGGMESCGGVGGVGHSNPCLLLVANSDTVMHDRLVAVISFGSQAAIEVGHVIEVFIDGRLAAATTIEPDDKRADTLGPGALFAVDLPPTSRMFNVNATLAEGFTISAVLVDVNGANTGINRMMSRSSASLPIAVVSSTHIPGLDYSMKQQGVKNSIETSGCQFAREPVTEDELILPLCDGVRDDLSAGEWIIDDDYTDYEFTNCESCKMQGAREDATQYRWKGDTCRLDRFDDVDFCSVLDGRNIIFVGDSLMGERFYSLLLLLGASLPNPDTMNPGGDAIRGVATQATVCGGRSVIRMVRTFSCDSVGPREFEHANESTSKWASDIQSWWPDWTDVAVDFDIILMSCTAHARDGPQALEHRLYQAIVDLARQNRQRWLVSGDGDNNELDGHYDYDQSDLEGLELFYLTQPPGHPNCSHDSTPLARDDETIAKDSSVWDPESKFVKEYKWPEYWQRNEFASKAFLRAGLNASVIDGAVPLGRRADGHHVVSLDGVEDCLHQRLPGPVDYYNIVLYSTLKAQLVRQLEQLHHRDQQRAAGDSWTSIDIRNVLGRIRKPLPRPRPTQVYFNKDWLARHQGRGRATSHDKVT